MVEKTQTRKRYGRRYFKRGQNNQRYGKSGTKPIFRAPKSLQYGIKPDPFPKTLHTRVKYCQSDNIITTLGGYSAPSVDFRLSSIWQCKATGGTTTVVGWTIFDSIFRRYQIMGIKAEVTFYNPNCDGHIPLVSLNKHEALHGLTLEDVAQDSLTYTSQLNNTGSQRKVFNFYIKPWSLAGLTKLEWLANKSDHSALLAANQADEIYLKISNISPNNGDTIHYGVRFIYYVNFYDRKQLTSSVV